MGSFTFQRSDQHMIEITLSDGSFVEFRPGEVRKFKGLLIPGSTMSRHDSTSFSIYQFDYDQQSFRYCLLHFHCQEIMRFTVRVKSSLLRLHTVVRGALDWQKQDGTVLPLRTGEVLTESSNLFRLHLPEGETIFFIVYLSTALISQTEGGHQLAPAAPIMMPPAMQATLQRIFNNPYEAVSRKGLYDLCTRELLFHQLATPDFVYEDVQLARERAVVYAAAQLIAADLGAHFSIAELAQRTNSNMKVIKRGFQRIYGMGPFEYRLQLKMELAQQLLSTTDKLIKEIALDAGYDDSTAFVREFRNQFGIPPRVWRLRSRGLNDE